MSACCGAVEAKRDGPSSRCFRDRPSRSLSPSRLRPGQQGPRRGVPALEEAERLGEALAGLCRRLLPAGRTQEARLNAAVLAAARTGMGDRRTQCVGIDL